mgnify:CR=1 FL=1|tara:strand:- start:104 stop:469 length:366 start_codon:yes stop_codon:yes gene_type:complete
MEYTDLTTTDYINILKGYDIEIPRDKKELKRKAEKVIAIKLCGCIKKVSNGEKKREPQAIGVCTKSVINIKGYTRSDFKCKRNGRKVTLKKKKRERKQNNKRGNSSKTTKSRKNTTRKLLK